MEIKDLEAYGLPGMISDMLIRQGYTKLTTIQENSVNNGLFEGKNLVVVAPTNTGKTFIAELAAIVTSKKIGSQRTFYLVPLKALAEEKFLDFKKRYEEYGLSVAVSTADRTEYDDELHNYNLIISTYEKLLALVIRNPDIVSQIGLIVVDELQNLGNEHRGGMLEILLTLLIHVLGQDTRQIIALSATILNHEEISKWLNAVVITTEKREIDLSEGVQYVGDRSFRFRGNMIVKGTVIYKDYNTNRIYTTQEPSLDLVSTLAYLTKKEQLLVFTWRKKDTTLYAEALAKETKIDDIPTIWLDELDDNVESTPSTRSLKKCISKKVAFHHAGLIYEERQIVSSAFTKGDVRIIFATRTLAEGVNTPAETVIILPNRYLNVNDYKNMSGRAGRIGFHEKGRSILIARNPAEFMTAWTLIDSPPSRVLSQIPKSDIDLQILSLIATGICKNVDNIIEFFKKSLFGYTYYPVEFNQNIRTRVQNLVLTNFVRDESDTLYATEMGKISAQELLTPKSTTLIYDSFVSMESEFGQNYNQYLEGIIHLACCTYDATTKNNVGISVPPSDQEKRELMSYATQNKHVFLYVPKDNNLYLSTIKTTQMLMRWIEGMDYNELQNFAEQGEVRRMAATIAWLVRGISRIIDEPLFKFNEDIVSFVKTISDRLAYGVTEEAVELAKLRIPGISRYRCMKLASMGYKTLNSLTDIDIDKLKELGVGKKTALEMKKRCEALIDDKNKRAFYSQKAKAKTLNKDISLLERLYSQRGVNFTRVCVDIFKEMEFDCVYMEDASQHSIDGLIQYNNEKITIGCKRKDEANLIPAIDAEEILGQSGDYEPASKVTIGYPDFAQIAINNCKSAKVTLLSCRKLGDLLVKYWEHKLDKDSIIKLLKSNSYDGGVQHTSIFSVPK